MRACSSATDSWRRNFASAGTKRSMDASASNVSTRTGSFAMPFSEHTLSEQVKYLEAHGIRPEYQADSYHGIRNVLDWPVEEDMWCIARFRVRRPMCCRQTGSDGMS